MNWSPLIEALLLFSGAALLLGASAAQIGSFFLRCPEAGLHPAWAEALGRTPPEGTMVSRVFSGRAGRSIATAYVRAASAPDAPPMQVCESVAWTKSPGSISCSRATWWQMPGDTPSIAE